MMRKCGRRRKYLRNGTRTGRWKRRKKEGERKEVKGKRERWEEEVKKRKKM